jgi:hypothetical protein
MRLHEQQRGRAAGGRDGGRAPRSADRGQTVTDGGGPSRAGADRFSLADAVPLIGQLRGYSKRALGRDAVAGLNIAATLVPQALAYGQVAGLTPAASLYTAVGAALAFSLVTSTRVVVVVPSSTLAIMTFAAVHGPAAGDPRKAAALAGCLAVLVGLLCVASPLLRMQRISDLLSEPVMLRYLAGSAVGPDPHADRNLSARSPVPHPGRRGGLLPGCQRRRQPGRTHPRPARTRLRTAARPRADTGVGDAAGQSVPRRRDT